jgi:hypothetical protein
MGQTWDEREPYQEDYLEWLRREAAGQDVETGKGEKDGNTRKE